MMRNGTLIRVVIIGDDRSLRTPSAAVLETDGDIVVLGRATTADAAVSLIAAVRPDVAVLDLRVDRGLGHQVIERIMARTPTAILVLSDHSDNGDSPGTVAAIVAGAVETLPAPSAWTPELGARLRASVRRIDGVHVIRHPRGNLSHLAKSRVPHRPVVAIGASTGGPNALAVILPKLGGLAAPVLVVQHLHPDFVGGLVDWMARVSALPVRTAEHGRRAQPGHVYFAPGGAHLRLGPGLGLELGDQPHTIHRPSADQLFRSVATHAGAAAVGVLLTGMGDDGAEGLLCIRRRGGHTLGQDEATSAVFGMPQAAQRIDAVTELLPLDQLAGAVHRAVRRIRP